MDIAGLSVVMQQSSLHQQVSVQVASKALDIAKQQGNDLIRMMEANKAINPSHLGQTIDIRL